MRRALGAGPGNDLVARALLVVGFGLLLLTWLATTPPGGFPDELDHYVRAVSVGRGELLGDPLPPLPDEVVAAAETKTCCVPDNPNTQVWVRAGARDVDLPASLTPEAIPCRALLPAARDVCGYEVPDHGSVVRATTMGTIEPAPYLLPGLLTRLTSDADTALVLARTANAVLALGLLAVAAWALWPGPADGGAFSIAGLLLAVSPMVLFVGASPSPSSVEALAGLAFMALLLRLVRPAPDAPAIPATRGLWAGLGVTGVLLATSRSLGPVWILIDVVAVAAMAGLRPTWSRVRDGGRRSAAAIGTVALATLSTVLWELAHQPGIDVDVGFLADNVWPSFTHVDDTLQELVGAFGSLNIWMPESAYQLWAGAGLLLATVVTVVGRWRDRALVLGGCVAVVGVIVLVATGLMRQNGFDVQGRHVLALAAALPLLAGELAQRRAIGSQDRRGEAGPRRVGASAGVAVVAVIASVTAAVHVVAVRASGIHYGWLGDDRAPAGTWTPPGGTAPWVAATVAGALALVAGTVTVALTRRAGTTTVVATAERASGAN